MARVEIKTNAQLQQMARAGVITSRALDAAVAAARPGATTAEVNAAFERTMLELGGTSNFYGYYDYPATVCTSVNHEVVHGIPGDYVLKDGDILSIDGGAYVIDPATNRQWHGDSARTVLVGDNVSEARAELSAVTREAMWHGIAALATAKKVGEIGLAIEAYVTEEYGDKYGIIEAFAIEPMLVTGSIETKVLSDDWTVVTVDGSDACQWEHSVAVHSEGIWVLTAEDGGASELARFGVTPVPIPA